MLRRVLSLRLLFFLAVCLAAAACGNDEGTPKSSLNDTEKQQIEELNRQRESEWGPTNKSQRKRN
jgi:hypothetical protein